MSQELKQVISRIEKLEKAVFGDVKPKRIKDKRSTSQALDIDFSLNERTFVKRYATNKSGPKKFTLLLAYIAGGKVDINVKLSEIRKCWSKMKAKTMLGKFNMFYPSDAKTRGWIDSREYGSYSLTEEWKKVL